MVLQICQATAADADEIASLHLLSFNSNVLLHAQFPTPSSLQGLHTFLSQDAIRDLQNPSKALVVVRDTETTRIVSFAKWDLPGPASQHADVMWPDGCQQQLVDEYYEKAEAAKKRVMGDAPCYCKILCLSVSFLLRSLFLWLAEKYRPLLSMSTCLNTPAAFKLRDKCHAYRVDSSDFRGHSSGFSRPRSWNHVDRMGTCEGKI